MTKLDKVFGWTSLALFNALALEGIVGNAISSNFLTGRIASATFSAIALVLVNWVILYWVREARNQKGR